MVRSILVCVSCCLVACSDDGKKKIGEPCESDTDCMDEICHVDVCVSKDPKMNGESCTLDAECRSFNCQGGACAPGTRAAGAACRYNVECASGVCRIDGALPGLCADSATDAGVDQGLDGAPDAGAPDLPPADAQLADAKLADAQLADAQLADAQLADTQLPDQLLPDQSAADLPPPDVGSCGGKDEPCCGSVCTAPLACISNLCVCGGKGEPCCTGDVCESDLSCTTSKTCACGGPSQACCGGTTCSGTLFCAGEACTCIKQLEDDHWLRTDGTVWAQIAVSTSQPITVGGAQLKALTQIASGGFTGCGRKSDGTVWCWARNTTGNGSGELGNGTIGGITTAWAASQVTQAPSGMLTGVASLSGAGSAAYLNTTTCAVKTDGTVWCWGASQADSNTGLFQVVNGPNQPRATQIKASATTMLTGAKQVSVKHHHACAVVSTAAACWGNNAFGQLGAGDTKAHLYPVAVTISGKAIKKVAVGLNASCALTTTGEVYCWGYNGNGLCGLGYTSTAVTGPAQVVQSSGGNLSGVADIAVGHAWACAIKTSGALLCWGGTGVTKATQQLDKSSQPIDDAALLTMDSSDPYRILKTNGEYWSGKSWKQTYSCP